MEIIELKSEFLFPKQRIFFSNYLSWISNQDLGGEVDISSVWELELGQDILLFFSWRIWAYQEHSSPKLSQVELAAANPCGTPG